MAQFETASQILTNAAAELGLGTLPTSGSLYDQLFALLNSTGRALVLENPWLQNVLDYSITTTTATTYALPQDFQSMVDGTGWNRTTRQPLVPVSPQQWEAMKAAGVVTAFPVVFRPGYSGGAAPQIELITAPSSGQTIALQYRSSFWVSTSSGLAASRDSATSDTDVPVLDSLLMLRALKLAWLRTKGFPSEAAQQDFESTLSAVRSANVSTAPVLRMGGGSFGPRLIDEFNVPETGYGS